jgi:hypothetical protein
MRSWDLVGNNNGMAYKTGLWNIIKWDMLTPSIQLGQVGDRLCLPDLDNIVNTHKVKICTATMVSVPQV